MPKTIFDKKQKYEKLLMLIRGTAAVKGTPNPEIAKMAGVGEATIYARYRNPENFTLKELEGIRRGLNIPIEDFREVAIR